MKRKELADKLTLVGNALATNDLVQLFTCFCFDGETVSAYNDALGIVASCVTAKPFAVNGPVLLGLLGHSLAEDVDFTVMDEAVHIKTGRSNFKLPYHPKADFLFEEPERGKEYVYIGIDADLITGLTACLLTSSTDNAQPAYMGICVHQGTKNMILYSTDGDAISRYVLNAPTEKVVVNRVLPNSFCQTLIKIMDETKAESGDLTIDDEWAIANLDSAYTIYGRLLQIDNPIDYERELGKTRPESMVNTEMPKGLELALKRARVLSDPESAKTVLTVESKKLRLLTETPMGVVRDSIPINHPDTTANVSAQLIQRCVEQCSHMLIRDNCVEFWGNENKLYIMTSNMGD